jgi:DNA-binding MarR family transcriptional regulator
MRPRPRRSAPSAGAFGLATLEPRDKLGGAPHRTASLQLWLRLASCATVVEKRLRVRFEQEFGTTLPRFEVLAAIGRHPTGPTMSQLSRSMMVSNGNVTAVVNRLIEDRLVARAVDGRDRRVVTVRLTRHGRVSLAQMEQEQERWLDAMFADLPVEGIDELMTALSDLRRSVERSNP